MMANNSQFKHLFNEDIYVLDSASAISMEEKETNAMPNNRQVVEEPKEEYVTEKKEETVIIETKIEEAVKEKSNSTPKFDESKVYIFSDYEISKPEKQFLAKILQAVKVDLHSIKVAEWNKDAKEFSGNNFVFNTQITECGLTGNRISAPPLHEIEQKVELKKALWENMQNVFL